MTLLYPPSRAVSHTRAARPPYAIAISPDSRRSAPSADDARLLPRYRPPGQLLERRRLERLQAHALTSTPLDPRKPLRHELTKPGDPIALRGIPVIGRGVTGAVRVFKDETTS